MTNDHTQEHRADFLALPTSPYLTHSWCDFTLIALHGLNSPHITTDKVTRITVNGVEQQTRMMGKTTVMVYPRIKPEGQRMAVHYTVPAEAPKPFKRRAALLVAPVESYGFTAPSGPYKGGI